MIEHKLVLYVRGTASEFDRMMRILEASGLRLADDGPGCAEIVTYRSPLWKSGHGSTVTQFIRKQVQP